MRIKKIAILLPSLNFGGAEKVCINIAKELKKIGFEIDFLLMSYQGDFLKGVEEKFKVINLKCNKTYKLPYLLNKYIVENKPDLIISNFWKLNLCISLNKIFNKNYKLLVWEHSPPSFEKSSPTFLYKITSSILYQFSDKIIAVSDGVKEDIIRITYGLKDKIVTIYNPIEPPCITNKVKINNSNVHKLIFVGRLTEAKNLNLLLISFARVLNKINATLLIVGDGHIKKQLIDLAISLNIQECVTFYGFTDNVYDLMQDSDLLVLSSNYEGFGNVIVEALYCGLKIVSTDCISGPREILNNGEFGSLVPVNDSEAFANAIIYELNYQRSIENQKNRAYNFLPSKIAMDLNSLICTL